MVARILISELEERVQAIETLIKEVITPDMAIAKVERAAMKTDLEEILGFVSGAKKAGSIVARYGPKIATFGAGIFTAAGIGNPHIWDFVTKFFAG